MKIQYPNTYRYLAEFRHELQGRAGYAQLRKGHPFYIMANTNERIHTPVKVVWARMGIRINAAVLGLHHDSFVGRKPILPQETLTYVPLVKESEAHYLCALLNTSIVTVLAKSYSVGKSFGSPHLLQQIAIPNFEPTDPIHVQLAGLSQRAHKLTTKIHRLPVADRESLQRELAQVEDQIDRVAAQLWGLTDEDLTEIRNALKLLS
jgi:hypothetical protein